MSRNKIITGGELATLVGARAEGFMDCKTIVRALYPDRFPDRPVRWEAAYRWLADVGVDVVYVIPDGRTDVPKAERTGCWPADPSRRSWRTRLRITSRSR